MQRMRGPTLHGAARDLQRTLKEMEIRGDVASAICPHCGAVHLAPGFSQFNRIRVRRVRKRREAIRSSALLIDLSQGETGTSST